MSMIINVFLSINVHLDKTTTHISSGLLHYLHGNHFYVEYMQKSVYSVNLRLNVPQTNRVLVVHAAQGTPG